VPFKFVAFATSLNVVSVASSAATAGVVGFLKANGKTNTRRLDVDALYHHANAR
jgi:hypothetical protein